VAAVKPLAMTLQLVLGQEDRKMYLEYEIVFTDGSTVLRKVPINTCLRLDFEELVSERNFPSAPPSEYDGA
jgi:hypothetical protein